MSNALLCAPDHARVGRASGLVTHGQKGTEGISYAYTLTLCQPISALRCVTTGTTEVDGRPSAHKATQHLGDLSGATYHYLVP